MNGGGKHHGGHHGHHKGGEMEGRGHEGHHPKPSPYVSREEFDLYDTIKTLSALSFCLFCKMIALGKCGKRATWRNKSGVTKWVMKKSCLAVVLMAVLGMFCGMQGHHIMKIKERVAKHHEKPHQMPMQMEDEPELPERPFEEDEEEMFERDGGRFLKSQLLLGNDEDTCNALSAENSCNANAKCSWCESSAVKSACHSLDNAKGLPAAVF